jgi:hypothetical protein
MPSRSLLAVIMATASTSVAFAASEHLEYRTPIMLHVASPVSSKTAHVGDLVRLVVARDVIVNGYVVIARRAEGKGVVDAVQPAHMSGVPGQLRIRYKWVLAVDKVTKIRVDGTFIGNGSQASDQTGKSLTNAQKTTMDHGATSLAQTISHNLNVFRHSEIGSNSGEAQLLPDMNLEVTVHNPKGVLLAFHRRANVSKLRTSEGDSAAR